MKLILTQQLNGVNECKKLFKYFIKKTIEINF